jgi:hypothetical protein
MMGEEDRFEPIQRPMDSSMLFLSKNSLSPIFAIGESLDGYES